MPITLTLTGDSPEEIVSQFEGLTGYYKRKDPYVGQCSTAPAPDDDVKPYAEALAETAASVAPPEEKPAPKKATRAKKADKAVEAPVAPSAEDAAQDEADEVAESEAEKTELTHDDVRQALSEYVKAYGMEAAQADGTKILIKMYEDKGEKDLGKSPDGRYIISAIPNTQEWLAEAVSRVEDAVKNNPFGRTKVA